MFHGQHLKETRGNSCTPPEKPQKQMHPNTYIQKKKKKCSPPHPYKIRNTPPRHIAQNKHSPKCSHWFMQMQTLAGRSVHPKSHTESERKHTTHSQQLLHFVYCHRHPGELWFLLFGGRYLLDSASVYSLPLAPHLVLSLGLGVLLPWRPRSLSQVGLSPGA